ncbi:transcription elongation factor, mitochondrial [Diorhabda sublineata]|uniref:transcription elongation factor, mitochondrial n=1 Tax=Diorhabda sublineata TaxID=1163346 RepID=UPI0024E10A01|nr:transcription elongation factor, mitochondrial [Diorhabda sublineata]
MHLQCLLQKTFITNLTKLNIIRVVKYSVSSSNDANSFYFKSNFSKEEQTKILNTLNDSNTNHLSRFRVPKNRIKNIHSWKNKKGPFRSLHEVLEVDGLGEKLLHRICQDIINEKCDNNILDSTELTKNNSKNKRQKQIITPPINGQILNKLTSAVGVHLSPIGISWAKLSQEQNKLVNWNFDSFNNLPKKMMPNDNFDMVINIIRKIPSSDVYIFETSPSMGPQNQTSASAYSQQLELSAMLFTLLNTSVHHNVTLRNVNDTNTPSPTSIENRVFYLKSRLSARLFSTLVGQEKVAAVTTINELLNDNVETSEASLPCTKIMVEQQLKAAFDSQTPVNKELLGQALMLVITFMDLCVYKNPAALDAVFSVSKKNKK